MCGQHGEYCTHLFFILLEELLLIMHTTLLLMLWLIKKKDLNWIKFLTVLICDLQLRER